VGIELRVEIEMRGQVHSSVFYCLALVSLLLVGCKDEPPVTEQKPVPAQSKEAYEARKGAERGVTATSDDDREALLVAVAPVISPEASLKQYKAFVNILADRVDRRGILLQRSSYSETNTLIRQRRSDIAFVCTYAFVQGRKDFGMELLVAPVVRGQSQYHSQLIVPSGSEADSIEDLKGRRFASADELSNTGWLYPTFVLRNLGHDHHGFFSDVVFTGGHDRSIRAVADGVAAGAAVDSLVLETVIEAEPEIGKRVKVIHTSPAFGNPPVVVHPGFDPKLRERVREVLLSLHESKEGADALGILDIDRFVLPDPDSYDAVERMMRVMESQP